MRRGYRGPRLTDWDTSELTEFALGRDTTGLIGDPDWTCFC